MEFRSKYETAWYKVGPVLGKPVGDWRFTRPVIDKDKCSGCGWCYLFCPPGCIKEEDDHFVIDLDYCKGCGVCARECPVDAITMINEEAE